MNNLNSRSVSAKETIISYSVKYAVARIAVHSVLLLLGAYLIFDTKFDYSTYKRSDYAMIVIGIGMILYNLNYIRKELSRLKKKLVLSAKGITADAVFHSWKNIYKEEIIRKQEHNSSASLNYEGVTMQFNSNNKVIEVNISSYDINEENIRKLLKHYRNEYNQTNRIEIDTNVFNNTIGFEDFIDLSDDKGQKKIDDILKLAEENEKDLIDYCQKDIYNKLDQIEFIYYALGEDYKRWEKFLVSELIRVFELSKTSHDASSLLLMIETISQDDNESLESKRVAQYLSKELDNSNNEVRLNALLLLEYWIDETTDKVVIDKIKSKLQDPDRKMRWNSYRMVKGYNFIDSTNVSISFMDRIKGRN